MYIGCYILSRQNTYHMAAGKIQCSYSCRRPGLAPRGGRAAPPAGRTAVAAANTDAAQIMAAL